MTFSSTRVRAAALVLLGSLGAGRAEAAPQRTWNFLTTGNGHGFSIYDLNKNKIVSFLEHPYRYLGPRPDPKSDGYPRRNLAFDVYFGVRGGASGWLNEPTAAADPSYVAQTNIILAPVTLGSVQAESYFFAPFGYEGNLLVALLKAPGATDGYILLNFHMGGGSPDTPDANGESLTPIAAQSAISETGPGGGAMVYVPLSGADRADCDGAYEKVAAGQDIGEARSCSGDDVVPVFGQALGQDGWMAFGIGFVEDGAGAASAAKKIAQWGAGRSPQQILDDAKAEWEAWRKPPGADVALCTELEKQLWRQSEAVLRMGQVREPYSSTRKNNGMVLASLPPGEWHSGWVRDATYAVVALARSGHYDEARAALDFFLNAEPVGKFKSYVSNQDYRISVVRYFGNGEEEADYSGQPSPNVEIDGWGMVLWAARQYVAASGDAAWLSSKTKLGPSVYEALSQGVAKPLEANLESNGIVKADSSIWEVHDDNKRHYAYTTMAAARGFCDMASLAKSAGRDADAGAFQLLSAKVKSVFLASFVDAQGALGGSLEELEMNQALDGAVAEAFTWNILDDFGASSPTAVATLEALGKLRVESGGFKRNDDGQSSYDNNEWILVDLRIANALRRHGRGDEADGYIAQIIDKASANFLLLPELYNAVAADGAIGRYAGSIPMVGYGGGAYIITMLDRSGLIEPNDCGDGKGKSLPKLSCEGIDTTPPGGSSSGGPGGDGTSSGGPGANIPYGQEPACLCRVAGSPGGPAWILVLGTGAGAWLAADRRRRRRGGR
ncbi:MAG: hypothetical protein HY744_26060 [Deltaproteobacteria bacterium]|nr:hypothetical protein [Deltaproteobacteria bacterium]